MNLAFKSFEKEHLPYWDKWKDVPHVKNTWFLDGYEPPEKIHSKIEGNGYDYPFVITLDEKPIGYIQCCDLDSYFLANPKSDGPYRKDLAKSFCVDLFLAGEDCLGKGYGTQIMKKFTNYIFSNFNCDQILIDPASSNEAAIRCYEKVGFKFVRYDQDGVSEDRVYIMELKRP